MNLFFKYLIIINYYYKIFLLFKLIFKNFEVN